MLVVMEFTCTSCILLVAKPLCFCVETLIGLKIILSKVYVRIGELVITLQSSQTGYDTWVTFSPTCNLEKRSKMQSSLNGHHLICAAVNSVLFSQHISPVYQWVPVHSFGTTTCRQASVLNTGVL